MNFNGSSINKMYLSIKILLILTWMPNEGQGYVVQLQLSRYTKKIYKSDALIWKIGMRKVKGNAKAEIFI